jgi:threonine/homoserine/homoserine lactone efflux protein
MFESILIGSGFAFAAAVQPGPLQAFLLSTVTQKGWKRTLPAACAPLLSDGPIALLVLLILNHITPAMYGVLQLAGGFLLLYFAWAGYRQWRRYSITKMDTHDLLPRTLFQATIVNILNPNPYLGWSLVLGPAIVARWYQQPINAVALIIAFYTTMVSVLASMIFLFGTTRFLSSEGRRLLILVSAGILAVIGIYQILAFILSVWTA